jgi:negative regulator of replication initiation
VKTTLEIDDDLYREAKAHASLTGQKMKDLVSKGLRLALLPEAKTSGPAAAAAARKLASCFAESDKLMMAAPRGPIAREHLATGRNRLDRP